jgi:thioredoxin 2
MTMGTAARQIVRCAACGAGNRVAPERLRGGVTAVCGKCGAALEPAQPAAGDGAGRPVTVTDQSFDELVLRAPMATLVDLWAPWCGPCRAIAPVLEAIAAELAGEVRIAKLNVDENPRTAARLGVSGIPTLVLYRGGREVDRLVGALPKHDLVRWLRAAA